MNKRKILITTAIFGGIVGASWLGYRLLAKGTTLATKGGITTASELKTETTVLTTEVAMSRLCHHRPKKYTSDDIAIMKTMKDDGVNVAEIARHFHLSRATIYNALKDGYTQVSYKDHQTQSNA